MQRRAAEESLTDHGKDNSNGRAHVGDAIRHKPGILGFLRQIGFMGATPARRRRRSCCSRPVRRRSWQASHHPGDDAPDVGLLAIEGGERTRGQLALDCRDDDGTRTWCTRTVDDQGKGVTPFQLACLEDTLVRSLLADLSATLEPEFRPIGPVFARSRQGLVPHSALLSDSRGPNGVKQATVRSPLRARGHRGGGGGRGFMCGAVRCDIPRSWRFLPPRASGKVY